MEEEYRVCVSSPVYVPQPPPPPFQARQPAEPANRQLGSGQCCTVPGVGI